MSAEVQKITPPRDNLEKKKKNCLGVYFCASRRLFLNAPGLLPTTGLEVRRIRVRNRPETAEGVLIFLSFAPIVSAGEARTDLPAVTALIAVHRLNRCHNDAGVRIHQLASIHEGTPCAGALLLMPGVTELVLNRMEN